MKLFLQSFRTHTGLDRLLEMAGGRGAAMAILPNAVDAIPAEARESYRRDVFDIERHFRDAGDPASTDLRKHFGDPSALRGALEGVQVLYAPGGNSFVLRRAMRLSKFDGLLPELLAASVVYAGWSAGTCVAGDSLAAVAKMDEPDTHGIGHPPGAPVWEGLGLVPFGIIPHHRSDHPEAEAADRAVAAAEAQGLRYRTLQDGETLFVDGERAEMIGKPGAD